jgi:predicted phosphoribosyltransferase
MADRFPNRREAGKQLAQVLSAYKDRAKGIVLALPRGGVPVGFEIARALGWPFDLMLVRKLGVPGDEELAMGAVAINGVCLLNEDIIGHLNISKDTLDSVMAREQEELKRRNDAYRGGRPAPDLQERTVILVDDGMATGADMRAAAMAVLQQDPDCLIVAVPVAPQSACDLVRYQADEVVCLQSPPFFYGVGSFYEDFSQTPDEEVIGLLEQTRKL